MDLPSDIYYWDDVYSEEESLHYFTKLQSLKTLKQGEVKLFGRCYSTPRLESFHGEYAFQYRYSNQLLTAEPFTKEMLEIKQQVELITKDTFNVALVNFYRNGLDSNGWHADNEKELGPNPTIASISFGASRTFKLRSNQTKQVKKITLSSGSLLYMGKSIQHQYQHCIPKEPKIDQPRINITFRTIQ